MCVLDKKHFARGAYTQISVLCFEGCKMATLPIRIAFKLPAAGGRLPKVLRFIPFSTATEIHMGRKANEMFILASYCGYCTGDRLRADSSVPWKPAGLKLGEAPLTIEMPVLKQSGRDQLIMEEETMATSALVIQSTTIPL